MDPDEKGLPLPAVPDMKFACLPEHLAEDLAEYITSLRQFMPQELPSTSELEPLVRLGVMFLASPTHVKNPYLRAKFLELLLLFTPQEESKNSSFGNPFQTMFLTSNVAKKALVPAIMRFYVDIEFTGSHTQFYDKFNVRYHISLLMKHLWPLPEFRGSFLAESRDHERFLRFVNMLINDSIYLLDESLQKLTEIREIEEQKKNITVWASLSPENKNEAEQKYQTLKKQVRSFLFLANEDTHMLHYLSEALVEPFMRAELVDRLASMLNYFFVLLIGPKMKKLKVDQPEEYGFKPRELLRELVEIYVH